MALVLNQGYSAPKVARSLGIAANMLYRWRQTIEDQGQEKVLSEDERDELKHLRKENKTCAGTKKY